MTAPLVSVLLTTYNHAPYVEQALDSVLDQRDFDDFELVITDDASTDDSADVVRRWLDRNGVTADFDVHERNLGICATRNRALTRSRGQLVCSLSGDDWYEPTRLARQASELAAAPPEIAAVYGDAREVDEVGAPVSESYLGRMLRGATPPSGDIFDAVLSSCFLPAMGVMVRRTAIDDVGGYDEALLFEDWDMWLRLADRYSFQYLGGGPVATRRVLSTSLHHENVGTIRWQQSLALIHAKWLRRDPITQRTAARRVQHAALEVGVADPREARRLLAMVDEVAPGNPPLWRAMRSALAIPGAGWGLGIAHARWTSRYGWP